MVGAVLWKSRARAPDSTGTIKRAFNLVQKLGPACHHPSIVACTQYKPGSSTQCVVNRHATSQGLLYMEEINPTEVGYFQ